MLTAHYVVVQDDHVGTHCDARKHIVPDAGGPETIPLEYCFSDGVLLDFTWAEKGHGITAAEIEAELDRIGYEVKQRDIVLIHTGAGAYNDEERYKTDHPGMSAEATRWLIERGVRMMGIDAITFDPPVWAMFEQKQFWEAHRVMWDEEYWHLENLMNLDQIGRRSASSSASCRSSGSARRARRCARSRSWRTDPCSCSSMTIAARDVELAGGKGASLARMTALGMPVPPGFVVPADALEAALARHRRGDPRGARARRARRGPGRVAEEAQALVRAADSGGAFPSEIAEAYARLGDGDVPVAVRSSATAEDSEAASFAGQQETFLHVRGVEEIVERIRDCWCSFFTERALFYRSEKGSLTDLGMAVVVQRMVQPDVSGVMFTIDPTKGRRDRMIVEAVFGLGEGVVSGAAHARPLRPRARRPGQAHAASLPALRHRPRP